MVVVGDGDEFHGIALLFNVLMAWRYAPIMFSKIYILIILLRVFLFPTGIFCSCNGH